MQLGVQIIEICMASRPRNGGLFLTASFVRLQDDMCFLCVILVKLRHDETWVSLTSNVFCFRHTVGLMALEDLHKKVVKSSKSRQDVTE